MDTNIVTLRQITGFTEQEISDEELLRVYGLLQQLANIFVHDHLRQLGCFPDEDMPSSGTAATDHGFGSHESCSDEASCKKFTNTDGSLGSYKQ